MWRSKSGWWCVFIFLAGCAPALPDVKAVGDAGKDYPFGVNTVVLNQTTVLNISDSLIFESSFSFLDLAGHFDIGGVEAKDFSFTSPGHYSILDFKEESVPVGNPQTAVMVLEDESGDYNTLDPHNFRSRMINKLCQDILPPGNFVVGGFSRKGSIIAPVEFSTLDFTTDWRSQQDFIFGLAQRTGGESSLYDALLQALNKLSLETAPNKNMIVLAHVNDSGSIATLNEVITRAVTGGIKIHILFLSEGGSVGDIPQLSTLTGGMFAILPTDQELITAFSQLYRLLTGKKYFYKLKVSYRPLSGAITSDVTHTLNIVDYIHGKDYNPVVIYTKIQ